MKNILENYLYLLTEDPDYDKIQSRVKIAKNKIVKLKRVADPYWTEYPPNSPKSKTAPNNVKKILKDYQEALDEFDKAKKEAKEHMEWISGGKKGSKPGSWNYRKSGPTYEKSYGDDFWNDFNKQSQERAREYEKTAAKERIAVASVYIAILLAAAYASYRKNHPKTFRSSDEAQNIKTQIFAINKQIEVLRKGINGCSRTNDPKKCKEKIINQIKILQVKISRLEFKLKHSK